MIFEEYIKDIEYIWKNAKKAGYTYIAAGMAVGVPVTLLVQWLFW